MKLDYSIYLVAAPEACQYYDVLSTVEQAIAGGVTVVQLRYKQASFQQWLEIGRPLQKLLQQNNIALIINDRVDIAVELDADGVHLGQSDMSVTQARKIIGPEKTLGLSIETPMQLAQANQAEVDYLGIGPVFPTVSKPDAAPAWGVAKLQQAVAEVTKPVVAIGGINQTNIAKVKAAGIDGAAVLSAICGAADPKLATQALVAAANLTNQ